MTAFRGSSLQNPTVHTSAFRAALLGALVLLGAHAQACFYSSYAFNTSSSNQTSARKLITGAYIAEEKEKQKGVVLAKEFKSLQKEYASRQSDPEFLEDYAYLQFLNGQEKEAFVTWSKLLKTDPKRYTTLCNVATAFQMRGRFADAAAYLARAIKVKPGFRNYAEEYHLQMLEFLERQRQDVSWSQRHLFLSSMTPVWISRGDPPAFRKARIPADINAQGVAELLRQFPGYGDAWLVLGMLLENSGDYHDAGIAYQHAMRRGTSQRAELDQYMKKYAPFESGMSPVRRGGVMFVLSVLAVFGLLFGRRLLRLVKAISEDRVEAEKAAQQLGKRPR